MKDFILNLYANENFPIYLGAIIIVLLIAFFVVFFLGKKDQKKIEMTQRLDKIKDDAFKEVSAPVNVTVASPVNETPLNAEQQIVQEEASVPVIDVPVEPVATPIIETPDVTPLENPAFASPVVDMPNTKDVALTTADIKDQVINSTDSSAVLESQADNDAYKSPQSVNEISKEDLVPKFNPDPVIEPYIPEPDLSSFNQLASSIELELNELEKQKELAKPILENANSQSIVVPEPAQTSEVSISAPVIEMPVAPVENIPVVNVDIPAQVEVNAEPVAPVLSPIETDKITIPEEQPVSKPTKVMTDVFSSVYAPKKETIPTFDDTMAIELPRLKNDDNN